jgi:DNA polymerase-3 subunit gamma/tau
MDEHPASETTAAAAAPGATPGAAAPYQVLARKYRPQRFDELIGQDAMVRTLSNAIREDRIAHAFVLTGVRGVGKTTTARIVAKALNCIGPDGQGGPTVEPCGLCEPCRAIAEGRHVDVLEMDAASHTGVDKIRDLLDGVRYLPVSARYRVYIVDEVHMLSPAAFNALLKTLEEPPEHVKFIFATTETRKIPVTVLSRCQRFDLRRVGFEALTAHFRAIAGREGVAIEDEALALIARAAEGSVRDGLSLLDQAIAHAGGRVGAAAVAEMLGLADRDLTYDLFEAAMRGDMAAALDRLRRQYDLGVEPEVVLQDLLELTHWLTRIKAVPAAERDTAASELERRRGAELAARLSMPVLARTWQMLLKGLGEVRQAPAALAAAEMVLVRLAYSADLPAPADLVRALAGGEEHAAVPVGNSESSPGAPTAAAPAAIQSFEGLVALANERKEIVLSSLLRQNVELVRFAPGVLEFRPSRRAPRDLAQSLKRQLDALTGQSWRVNVSQSEEAAPTLAERERLALEARTAEAASHPTVRAVLQGFPGAEIRAVRELGAADGDEGRE